MLVAFLNKNTNFAKRSRYYQALIDTGLLEPGIPSYNLLNNSYIIMIMTFDLFGYGKYVYTFEPACREVPECKLKDGAVRIFLNTKGKNKDEVSKELIDFLHYVENTTAQVAEASDSERIKRIHECVRKVKLSEKVGVKYMQKWEEDYYNRQEAREEGFEEGKEEGMSRFANLTKVLLQEGKQEELLRATEDEAYREKLMEEYQL